MMEQYLKTGVKPVIESFPAVGAILERYGIACVQCGIGTCRLEDVLEIHSLAPDDEMQMMLRIEKAIYPEREPRPRPVRARRVARGAGCSPPVRRLVDEHTWIKRLLAVIPAVVGEIEATGSFDPRLMEQALDFIRGYADRFHHLKEEDILFDYADREAEIIKVILQDHQQGRSYVRAAGQAVQEGDIGLLCSSLLSYRELLTEHIRKEDEVLYPYLDRGLTTSQVGEIFRRFEEAEGKLDHDIPARYERFILSLEERFKQQDKEAA